MPLMATGPTHFTFCATDTMTEHWDDDPGMRHPAIWFFHYRRFEAITSRSEAIAGRPQGLANRVEAIAIG